MFEKSFPSLKKAIVVVIFMMAIGHAFAEYRAYQYFLKSMSQSNPDKMYSTISALDPTSFAAYHGGHESIQIDLVRTWKCPGHTGHFQTVCPSPYLEIENEGLENAPRPLQ